jgi:hypothetical protein
MSGMAGKVRRATESDEFDLGGYTQESCMTLAKAAFSEPLELSEMVRLSFVVGGGKLVRQKYDDNLPKMFCGALDSVGYKMDNASAIELSSAGTYKMHHDTNKNLKFIHVFPRVAPPEAGGGAEEGAEGEEEEEGERDPADVLAECELEDFQRIVTSHVITYASKKRLLDAIKARLAKLDEAERKLIEREPLDDELQALYDKLSADGLKQKVQVLAVELQAMIDAAELTSEERAAVLEQLDGKLEALQTELAKAEADGKAKMKAKLEENREKLKSQRAKVSESKPAPLSPLKYATEIQKLTGKLATIARIEKSSSGKFTLDELKKIGERPEIEEAISVYKERSRSWFESDEEFGRRYQLCLSQVEKKKSSAPAANSTAGYPGGAWSTVGSKRK